MLCGTNHPTVSFIVPNCNDGHYLGECLESAVGQTFTDWEIVIIDDSSTDSSVQVARDFVARYPEKIRLIELQNGPVGIPGAVNTGIRAMRGRYFSWLDSGDRCAPERLEKLVAVMESTPQAGMAHTGYRFIDGDGNESGVAVPEDYSGVEAFYRLLEENIIDGSTVLVRKDLLDKIGPLLETHSGVPDLLRVSEYLLWLDVALRADIAVVREPLHYHRLHALNSEYNRSTLGRTLIRIGKRHFLKQHGLKNVVSRVSARSGQSRSQVCGRLAAILLREADASNIALFLDMLADEDAMAIQAVQSISTDLQRRINEQEILEFYLSTNSTVAPGVLKTFTFPCLALEQLILKLLNNATAEFNSGNFIRASRDLKNLLRVTGPFKNLDVKSRHYLALALDKLGDRAGALVQREALLRLDPSHQKAAEFLRTFSRSSASEA